MKTIKPLKNMVFIIFWLVSILLGTSHATTQCQAVKENPAMKQSMIIHNYFASFSSNNPIKNRKTAPFQRATFTTENLECISTGQWPDHSRSPCEVDPEGKAGLRKIVVTNCAKDESQDITCDWEDNEWLHAYMKRVNIIDSKILCDYEDNDKTKAYIPGSCKWVYKASFKPYEADLSPLENILIYTLITCIFILMCTCCLCENNNGSNRDILLHTLVLNSLINSDSSKGGGGGTTSFG
jgi:hypothetical protein